MDRMIKDLIDVRLTNIDGINEINELIKERDMLEKELEKKSVKRKHSNILQERHLLRLRKGRLLNKKEKMDINDFIRLCRYESKINELTRIIEQDDIHRLEEEFELEGKIKNITGIINSILMDTNEERAIYDTPEVKLPQRGTCEFDESYYSWTAESEVKRPKKRGNKIVILSAKDIERRRLEREKRIEEQRKIDKEKEEQRKLRAQERELERQYAMLLERARLEEEFYKEQERRKQRQELINKYRTISLELKSKLNNFIREGNINNVGIDEVEAELMFEELSKNLFRFIGRINSDAIKLKENDYFVLEYQINGRDNVFLIKGKDELNTNIIKASNNNSYERVKDNFYKILKAYKKLEEFVA